ncbi:hypothetical protein [Streptomyces tirandamycinicus]|uniref:Uncharacterized protein n=1 Tax=Streptomyces tirandamycinicus TaxID=2174846 RepID=A0A2S1T1T8_9ACTN|nr:hypothetical protein [Streptomyces tirandamycinicus]AWI32629.1 hypothetical protein DDW44_30385 [Streptomyces tirandamycinicus]
MDTSTEPEQAPPWRPEDGPAPTVWLWPAGNRPGLFVLVNGRWRYAVVQARHDYPDGRVSYQVEVDVHGSTSITSRSYWWPQEGLKAAHGSTVEPTRFQGRYG